MTLVRTGNHVGDTNSLPKWAQGYVDRLEKQVERQAELLRAQHVIDSTLVAIKPRMRITSTVDQSSYDRLECFFRPDGDLEVFTTGLTIEPQASNRVIIHRIKKEV
jgi:hypothetical protein